MSERPPFTGRRLDDLNGLLITAISRTYIDQYMAKGIADYSTGREANAIVEN